MAGPVFGKEGGRLAEGASGKFWVVCPGALNAAKVESANAKNHKGFANGDLFIPLPTLCKLRLGDSFGLFVSVTDKATIASKQ